MTMDLDRAAARVDADFLGYRDLLGEADRRRLDAAVDVFERSVRPVIADHWSTATFPSQLIPVLSPLDLVSPALDGRQAMLGGLLHMELSRVDLSMSTFLGVHSMLFTAAIHRLGSEEQRKRLLPDLLALRAIGAFALTEPDHGSDISRRMETTAARVGDIWTLNGSKRWIGNGTHADHLLVWARDTADDRIKGFIVPRDTPGVNTSPIEDKIGLRIVQNADIRLDQVLVGEENRLPGAESFRDTNQLLMNSRVWVAWQTVGLQLAAYEYALAYALEREQFGKPIASFQMVQEKLVRILDNLTASLGVMVRVAQLQEAGTLRVEHASLAKAGNSGRMRESVAHARALLGGNGIVADYGIARTFADAEAVFSYEGSFEINTLVVGRAITGISAF
jgi:glutaryl-CoA dehydrogenase